MENTETLEVFAKGDGIEIVVQHDQTGSAYGIDLSKDTYEQLLTYLIKDLKPIKARHDTLGDIEIIGVRTECSRNNNKMYMVKDENKYFWVYDYETELF